MAGSSVRHLGLGLALMLAMGAALVLTDSRRRPAPKAAASATPTRSLAVVYFGPDPMVDRGIAGLLAGLRQGGYEEGRNLSVLRRHAQGEMAMIPQLIRQLDDEGLDLLVPMTTPCLTAALAGARRTPIVFAVVYDPLAAGAGESFEKHRPNVTGVGSFPPLAETMDYLLRLKPGIRKVGTLYNPSEPNSCKAVAVGRDLLKARRVALEEIGVQQSAELYQAAQALAGRGVEAFWITGDNTAIAGFPAIARVAADSRLPLVCNDLDMLRQGALAAVGISPFEAGAAAGVMAARVLGGESPAGIAITNVSVRQLALNPAAARAIGLDLTPDLIAGAELLAGPP